MKTKLTGIEAIEFAERYGMTLRKYADPTEDARGGLNTSEARKIALDDPSLIWLETDLKLIQCETWGLKTDMSEYDLTEKLLDATGGCNPHDCDDTDPACECAEKHAPGDVRCKNRAQHSPCSHDRELLAERHIKIERTAVQ